MQWKHSKGGRDAISRIALVTFAAGGVACALAMASPVPANPDSDREGAQRHFLSGGERSAVALREIKEVLERIDSRLQRMEDRLARAGQVSGPSADDSADRMENAHGSGR